jgi:hypothetical protein
MSLLGELEDMAKKYLSLEEAASLLDMTTEQLMKIREHGDIRGFADRGSWKFREQDIDEFQRSRQADSSPDFPIITGDSSSSVLEEPDAANLSSSDSDVRLFFDESLFDEDDAMDLATSGSDVRLSGDSGPNLEEAGSDDELDLSGWGSDAKISDSDSDVKLVGAGTQPEVDLSATIQMKSDSDSDVVMVPDTVRELDLTDDSELKISDSDSDVRLSGEDDDSDVQLTDDADSDDDEMAATALFDAVDSDSDVKLMGTADLLLPDEDSDSDVKLSADLDRTDSDIRLAEPSPPPIAKPKRPVLPPDDSDLKLINKGSGVRIDSPDSGISLNVRGSGLGLDADESGISLEMDSGISLEADDSGISLESYDSGISLEGFESNIGLDHDSGISMDIGDSGISLDDADSGLSLDLDDDSGISMNPKDLGRTMPMQAIPGAKAAMADSTAMTTPFEIPEVSDSDDGEFELGGLDDDDDDQGASTGVLRFDDDDEDMESSNTESVPVLSGAAVEDETGEDEFVDDDGEYDDDGGYDDYEDDDNLDVQDAEDFEDEVFDSGERQIAGLPASTRMRADVDWSTGTKIMIGISAMMSVLCAVVGIELVRTMWLWTQPSGDAPVSSILQMIGGAF